MLALLMDGYGAVEATRLAVIPPPECGSRDLLIRNAAAGINPVEYKEIAGAPGAAAWRSSRVFPPRSRRPRRGQSV